MLHTFLSSQNNFFASIQCHRREPLQLPSGVLWSEMVSPVSTLSPSLKFLNPLKWNPMTPASNCYSCYYSLKPLYDCNFPRPPPALVFVSALSFNRGSRKHVYYLSGDGKEVSDFRVKAAADAPGGADDSEKSKDLVRTLQLGSMFVIWYLLNIYFNIYNKQVSFCFPFYSLH